LTAELAKTHSFKLFLLGTRCTGCPMNTDMMTFLYLERKIDFSIRMQSCDE